MRISEVTSEAMVLFKDAEKVLRMREARRSACIHTLPLNCTMAWKTSGRCEICPSFRRPGQVLRMLEAVR